MLITIYEKLILNKILDTERERERESFELLNFFTIDLDTKRNEHLQKYSKSKVSSF